MAFVDDGANNFMAAMEAAGCGPEAVVSTLPACGIQIRLLTQDDVAECNAYATQHELFPVNLTILDAFASLSCILHTGGVLAGFIQGRPLPSGIDLSQAVYDDMASDPGAQSMNIFIPVRSIATAADPNQLEYALNAYVDYIMTTCSTANIIKFTVMVKDRERSTLIEPIGEARFGTYQQLAGIVVNGAKYNLTMVRETD